MKKEKEKKKRKIFWGLIPVITRDVRKEAFPNTIKNNLIDFYYLILQDSHPIITRNVIKEAFSNTVVVVFYRFFGLILQDSHPIIIKDALNKEFQTHIAKKQKTKQLDITNRTAS